MQPVTSERICPMFLLIRQLLFHWLYGNGAAFEVFEESCCIFFNFSPNSLSGNERIKSITNYSNNPLSSTAAVDAGFPQIFHSHSFLLVHIGADYAIRWLL